jgi:hypothetical protein
MTLLFRYLSRGCRLWRALGGLLVLLSCQPLAGWAQAFGPAVVVGAYADNGQSTVAHTAIDAQGYVYVVGSFYGTAQFGSFTLVSTNGFTQAFVAKIDGAGTYQWVKLVEGPYVSFGSALTVNAAGVATIGGRFYGATATLGTFTLTNSNTAYNDAEIFVAQLDPAGNWLWANQAGGTSHDEINSLAQDAGGNIYLTGGYASAKATFGSTVLTNANPGTTMGSSYDLFVAKLTPQGTWAWARSGGGSSNDGGASLAVDASANVYLTGQTQGPTATFGSFELTGMTGINRNVLVAKLDASGTWLWAKKATSNTNDAGGGAIALDAAGNAYITGSFSSPTITFGPTTLPNIANGGGGYGDIFVAKLDAAGAWQWAVRAGGDNNDSSSGIALDGAGRLTVVGSFSSNTAQFGTTSLPNTAGRDGGSAFGGASIFLAYLSLDGAWLGAIASQGGGDKQSVAVAVDAYGNASVGGSFQGFSLTLGPTTLAGAGQVPTGTGFVTLVPMVPAIASFAPGSGSVGQVVTVTGTGFAGVTAVLFNGVPAPTFTVQSATRLLATVPAGNTAGPVSVRTSSSMANSGTPFQQVALAAAGAQAQPIPVVWPNPVGVAEPWQVRLPPMPQLVPTRAEVYDLLGQLVFQAQFSGQVTSLLVPHLAPGIYQLTLRPAGQPSSRHRVVIAD